MGIAISPDLSKLAIANRGSNTVSILVRASLELQSEIPVGVGPLDLVFADDSNKLFVSVSGGVAVVDVADQRITQVLTACAGPREIALTFDFNDLYVACNEANSIAVFDTATGDLVKLIEVGRGPTGVAVSEDNRWVFVTNTDEHTVSVLNTTTREVKSVAAVGQRPTGVVAAGQPATPVQFRPDSPVVIELPRTGVGRTTEPDSQLGFKIVVGLGLAALPFASGVERLRRRRLRRLHEPEH